MVRASRVLKRQLMVAGVEGRGSGGVAPRDQGLDFPLESRFAGEPLLEAGAGQYAELDLRHPFGKLRTGPSQLPCLGV